MMKHCVRKGYILLLTVLTVGTVSSASAIAILLLGISIERNAYSIQLSTQAFAGAWTCVERAIRQLQDDLSYKGNETHSFQYAYEQNGAVNYASTTCTIYPVTGDGNYNRTICTQATFGNFTVRRLEVSLGRVSPAPYVESWEEVDAISSCPT